MPCFQPYRNLSMGQNWASKHNMYQQHHEKSLVSRASELDPNSLESRGTVWLKIPVPLGHWAVWIFQAEVTPSGAEIRFTSAPTLLSPDDVLSFGDQAVARTATNTTGRHPPKQSKAVVFGPKSASLMVDGGIQFPETYIGLHNPLIICNPVKDV